MDRRVALELLGLDPDELLAHDRVRRAYLRRLRAHPPERDPDGFRRLREAFELLEPLARMAENMAEHMAQAAERHEGSAASAVDATAPEPERAAQLRGRTRALVSVAVFAPPDARGRPDAPDAPDRPALPVTTGQLDPAGASDERSSDWPDEPDTDDDLELPDEPWIDLRGEAVKPVPPASLVSTDEAPTLGEVTDELLALLERGELDTALELADRWHHSALDDHREVSAHVAWRWALTRELLDVAAALPDPLLRAIAHGIAADELASACEAAERYRTSNPSRAHDLARHLAKRADNLHKVLGSRLQSREQDQAAARTQRSSTGKTPIWIAVLVASALARAASTCDREPSPAHQFDQHQVPTFQSHGSQHDLRLDPEPSLKLDPEMLRRLRKAAQQTPSKP